VSATEEPIERDGHPPVLIAAFLSRVISDRVDAATGIVDDLLGPYANAGPSGGDNIDALAGKTGVAQRVPLVIGVGRNDRQGVGSMGEQVRDSIE
jgi:hypothetical protein